MEELTQLINDCIAKNRLSQEKLYRRFYPALFLLCKRISKDDRDALEALNDGMLKVFKNLSRYDNTKGDFFNWMYTIVRNTALDKLKSSKLFAIKEINEVTGHFSYDNPLQQLEWKDIYQLLDVLTPAVRVVTTLFYIEDFSINDISQKLQVSKGTIKWHLSEARKKIKPVLENYYNQKFT